MLYFRAYSNCCKNFYAVMARGEHPVSRFCIVCFFGGLILSALGGLGITALCAELGKNEIPSIITTVGSYFIKRSLGGVLFRIFIAMFIGN